MALCAETGGIVFPAVYCGTATMKPYAGFDCTLEFSQDVVRMLAREYLHQLADEGFKVIVIVMGHYSQEQMDIIREEVAIFNREQEKAIAWAFPDFEPTAADGFPGEHGACFETSYMMWFYPESVDMSRLPQDREIDFAVDGIGGQDPRGCASAKKGRDGTDSLVRNASPKILQLLKEKSRCV
jgi:creatinine amidohydrolase/Fe(II)-dependent formamide hydrolase-like protein